MRAPLCRLDEREKISLIQLPETQRLHLMPLCPPLATQSISFSLHVKKYRHADLAGIRSNNPACRAGKQPTYPKQISEERAEDLSTECRAYFHRSNSGGRRPSKVSVAQSAKSKVSCNCLSTATKRLGEPGPLPPEPLRSKPLV